MNGWLICACACILILLKDYATSYLVICMLFANQYGLPWKKDHRSIGKNIQKYSGIIRLVLLTLFISLITKNIIFFISFWLFYPFKQQLWEHKIFGLFALYVIGRIFSESLGCANLFGQIAYVKGLSSLWFLCFLLFYKWKEIVIPFKKLNASFYLPFILCLLGCCLLGKIVFFIEIQWRELQWTDVFQKEYINLSVKNIILLLNMFFFLFIKHARAWIFLCILMFCNLLLNVRTGCIALLFSSLIFWLLHAWPRAGLIGGFCVTLGVSGVFWKGFQLIHRVGSFFGQYLHFAKSRLFIWDELNELGRSYQWWGMGPHTLSRMLKEKYFLILLPDHSGLKKFPFVHPHNIFFELKGALGTVGYWLAIGAFLNEIFKLYQNPSAEPCSFRSICMIYILFCMNFYSFFREGNILFVWTMLLIMINAWYEKKDSHRSLNTISPQEAVMPT